MDLIKNESKKSKCEHKRPTIWIVQDHEKELFLDWYLDHQKKEPCWYCYK